MAVLRGAAGVDHPAGGSDAGGGRWAALAGLSSSVGGAGGCAAAVRSGKAGRLWALCRLGRAGAGAWSSWAAVCCWRGHLVRRWRGLSFPVQVVGGNIRVLCPALPGYFPAFPRGGRRQHPARAGLLIRQAGQAGRRRKRKRPGRRRVVRCCSGLLSALAVRSAAPGASRCISWAAGVCSPFRCRAAGAGTDPGATVPAGNVPAWHGLRWRCSIRCVFAVCRRGQILHFTG